MRIGFCEACGAPLEAAWERLVVACAACGGHNVPDGPVPQGVPVDERVRLNVGGRTYVLEALLAEGDSASVYRGRWVSRLGETVVVKVLAARADGDLLRHEWDTLGALAASTVIGAEHFVTRLPNPVAFGVLPDASARRQVAIYGWKSGFVHTLTDVGHAHGTGVPGEVQVWVLKRLLELLDFVHRAGFVHGAVTPDHVLVHPRDHGAMLVGWTAAAPWRAGAPARRLAATPARWAPLYRGARDATPALDLAMACRSVLAIGPWRAAPVEDAANGGFHDARALLEAVTRASFDAFGPAAWHPLPMPGWR